MSSREQNLALAKSNALEYLKTGDKRNAALSLMSDFRKWSIYDTDSFSYTMLLMASMNPDIVDVKFITGFN